MRGGDSPHYVREADEIASTPEYQNALDAALDAISPLPAAWREQLLDELWRAA